MSGVYDELTWTELLADPTVSQSIGFIDLDYYKDIYFGTDPDDDDLLQKLIIRASDDINAKSGWQITDITDYEVFVKNLIYKATAAQVEWYVNNGDVYNETPGNKSEKLGKFSVSGSGKATPSGTDELLCARSLQYFEQTGFAYRGVIVLKRDGYDDDDENLI